MIVALNALFIPMILALLNSVVAGLDKSYAPCCGKTKAAIFG
jgi:hypothetical protein